MVDLGSSRLRSVAGPLASPTDADALASRAPLAGRASSLVDAGDRRTRAPVTSLGAGARFDSSDRRSLERDPPPRVSAFDASDRKSARAKTQVLGYFFAPHFQLSPAGVASGERESRAAVGPDVAGAASSSEGDGGGALSPVVGPPGAESLEGGGSARTGASATLAGAGSVEAAGAEAVAVIVAGAVASGEVGSPPATAVRLSAAGASDGVEGEATVVPSFVLGPAGPASAEAVAAALASLSLVGAGESGGVEGDASVARSLGLAGAGSGEGGGTHAIDQFAGQFAGAGGGDASPPALSLRGTWLGVASVEGAGEVAVRAFFPVAFYPSGIPTSESVVLLRGSADGESTAPEAGPMPSRLPSSVVTSKAPRSR